MAGWVSGWMLMNVNECRIYDKVALVLRIFIIINDNSSYNYVFFSDSTLSCDYALSQCIKSADLVTPSYRDSLVAMTTQQRVGVSA